jgi:carnitine O-acetyltransferase
LEIRKLLRQIKRRGTSADKTATRAREAEDRPLASRLKSRGRIILGDGGKQQTPAESIVDDDDDDGLGGYGFFDAGMLRQALNANRAQNEPVERDVIRRNIGRRLRLAEY